MSYHCIILVSVIFSFFNSPVQSDDSHWRMLKKIVQKDIVVVTESESILYLVHPIHEDTIRVGLAPCVDCDISGVLETKRGGNPYRVWIAHEKFWHNPDRPRSMWGEYFRASFLRILRPPPN